MTKLLEEAFRKASALPRDRQDRLGAALLAKIAADEQWEETLSRPESGLLLDEWAADAILDFREGRTEALGPETL